MPILAFRRDAVSDLFPLAASQIFKAIEILRGTRDHTGNFFLKTERHDKGRTSINFGVTREYPATPKVTLD